MPKNNKNGHAIPVDSVVAQQPDVPKKIAASAGTPATTKSVQSVTKERLQLQECSYNYNTSYEILAGLKQKYPDAANDLLEWMADDLGASAIAPKIALENFTPIWDAKAIANFLGWKGYYGEPGWIAGGQFKPMEPVVFPDGKECKYLTSKSGYDAALLKGDIDWDAVADDPTEAIALAEGSKKAASEISRGETAISLPGVDMGHKPGKRGVKLVPSLERFAVPGRPIIFEFDADIVEKTSVQDALIHLATTLKKKGCVVTVKTWPMSAGKGIDDVIANGNFNQVEEITYKEFTKKLEKQFPPETAETSNGSGKKLPAPSVIPETLSEQWRGNFIYDERAAIWRKWTGICWEQKHSSGILASISAYIRSNQWKCSSAFLRDCERFLRLDLRKEAWASPPSHLINFRNGVLDLNIDKLEPHSREYGFVHFLDRDYFSLEKTGKPLEMLARHAPIFSQWLNDVTEGKIHRQLLILAAIAGVVRGEFARLQKFLQITGFPGSGKGTLSRIIEKIIGKHNAEASSLRNLCGSNPDYAISKIIDKQLVTLPDEDTASKNLGVIKSLTGGDRVDYRAPYSPPASGSFSGTLMILSNGPAFAGSTSGLDRRLCLIPMNYQIENQDPTLENKLDPELGAITSVALSLPVDQVRSLINANIDSAAAWEQKCQTSSMAEWMEYSLAYEEGASTPLKVLTEHYREWCEQHNEIEKSHKKFSPLLCEFSRDVFKRKITIEKKRTGRIVHGIRLATSSDLILSQLFVTDVDGSVTVKANGSNFLAENVSGNSVTDVTVYCQKDFFQPENTDSLSQVDRSSTQSSAPNEDKNSQIKCSESEYTDYHITEIIETLCQSPDRQMLINLSKAYGLNNPQIKQRVWAKMTPEQRDKVKARANTLPNGVEVGKDYTAVNGERLRLLGVFEHTTSEGKIILMGRCEYLSDGAACETRLDFLRE